MAVILRYFLLLLLFFQGGVECLRTPTTKSNAIDRFIETTNRWQPRELSFDERGRVLANSFPHLIKNGMQRLLSSIANLIGPRGGGSASPMYPAASGMLTTEGIQSRVRYHYNHHHDGVLSGLDKTNDVDIDLDIWSAPQAFIPRIAASFYGNSSKAQQWKTPCSADGINSASVRVWDTAEGELEMYINLTTGAGT